MWKLVIPAVAVALTGCGGGGGGVNSDTSATPASGVYLVSRYRNELNTSQVFNSAVADLNSDGLDDIVVSGWAVAPSTYTGTRSGFVSIRILIQQLDGSLKDQTDSLIGESRSVIWGSQRTLITDLDQDGRPDIAVLGFQDGPAAVSAPSVIFWNDGHSFSRHDLPDTVWAHAACAGDLNGDGLAELVTGSSGGYTNTIYSNQGQRQLTANRNLTTEGISSAGACAVIKDPAAKQVAIVTTNIPWYPMASAVTKVWDSNFNLIKVDPLPGSEEPGYNLEIFNDIVNVIPIDINSDGLTDLIATNNGDWRLEVPNGHMSVLINQGNFVFDNQTEKYLPQQSKTNFFNYYYRSLTIDGYPAVYFDHLNLGVSLWQIKNGAMVRYQERLLNALSKGYRYTNIYRTQNGLSLFLIDDISNNSMASFLYRPIPL